MSDRARVRVPTWGKLLWGAGVIVLNVAAAAGVMRYSFLLDRLDLFPALARVEPVQVATLVGAAFSLLIVTLVALCGSIAHLWRWSGLTRPKRLAWLVVLLLTLQPGLFLYWLFAVVRDPAPVSAATSPHAA